MINKTLLLGIIFSSLVSLAQSPESTLKTGCELMEHDNRQIISMINDPDLDFSSENELREAYERNAKLLKSICDINMPPLSIFRNSVNEDQTEISKYRSYTGYLKENDLKMYNRINIRIYEDESIDVLDKEIALNIACREYCNEKGICIKRY